MKTVVRHFAIATIFLLFSAVSYGQDYFLNWSKSRPLKWEDFSGIVNDTSNFEAECFAQVRYTYKVNSPKDFRFNVEAIFDKSTSWIKPSNKSKALLKHEQVHFDIAQLYACKLQQAFNTYPYTSNFSAEILAIFDALNREYHTMQKLYDEQSNHSLALTRQRQWEVFVETELISVSQLVAANNSLADVK
jgi:hypothetical protein